MQNQVIMIFLKKYNLMIKNFKTKKPKYKELAIVLGVSESAIKQYNHLKR